MLNPKPISALVQIILSDCIVIIGKPILSQKKYVFGPNFLGIVYTRTYGKIYIWAFLFGIVYSANLGCMYAHVTMYLSYTWPSIDKCVQNMISGGTLNPFRLTIVCVI